MPEGEILGHGRIVVEVEENVSRELAAVERKVEKTMNKIERERASMTLDANLAPLQKKVEEAEAKVKEFTQKRRQKAELGLSTKQADAALARWEAKLKERREARDTIKLDSKNAERQLSKIRRQEEQAAEAAMELDQARKASFEKVEAAKVQAARDAAAQRERDAKASAEREQKAAEAAQIKYWTAYYKAAEKARKDKERADAAASKAEQKRLADEAKAREKAQADYWLAVIKHEAMASRTAERDRVNAWKAEAKATKDAERALREATAAEYEAITAESKHELSVAKLQQRYVQAAKTYRRLSATNVPFQSDQRVELELKTKTAHAEVAALAAEIKALGGITPEVRIDVNKGFKGFQNRLGNSLRKQVDRFQDIGNVAVRIGPLTASLGGLLRSMVILGPVVTSLVGSLSALAGVTGAGLVGAVTLAGGAMTGMGLAAAGMFMAIKPVVGEITNATKASAAYDKAVREHGKGSEEAAKKLKIFNNVMKNQSAESKRNYLAAGQMVDAWKEATEPSRQTAFETMGKGLKFASDNMGWFAQRTNTATKAVSGGLVKWMDRLNSSTGRGALQGMFDSFNRGIPHIMNGIGNLGAYLGKVFQVGAKEGESMFVTFERWTSRVNRGFNADGVKRMVGYAKDLGNFLLAAGRALKTFFGGGAREGSNFLRDMTRGLQKWDKSMASGPGREKLQNFFHDAVENTQALWGVLAPIGGQFITWATNIAPFATAVLQVTGLFARFVALILRGVEGLGKLVGMGNMASTLMATLGVMWSVSKIGAFAAAVVGLGSKLRGLLVTLGLIRAASTAALATGGLSALPGAVGGAMAAGKAAQVAATATAATTAVAGTTSALAAGEAAMLGYGAAATGAAAAATEVGVAGTAATGILGGLTIGTAAATAGVGLLAVGAGVLAYKLLKGKDEGEKLSDEIAHLNKLSDSSAASFESSGAKIDSSAKKLSSARAQYKAATEDLKRLKKGTDDYREAELRQYDARVRMNNARYERGSAADVNVGVAKQEVINRENALAKARTTNAEKIADAQRQLKDAMDDTYGPASVRAAKVAGIQAELDALLAQRTNAVRTAQNSLTASLNRRAAATLNASRAEKNMQAVQGANAQKLGALARAKGGKPVAQEIALKYKNPDNVGKVSAAARSALAAGMKQSVVLRVIANTKDAEGAFRKLTAWQIKEKLVKMGIRGDDGVMSKLSKVDQKKIKEKIAKIIASGHVPTMAQIDAIIRRQIRDKHFSIFSKAGQALTELSLVAAGIDRVRSKSITISVNRIERSFKDRGPSQGQATGGMHGPSDKRMARAYAAAEVKGSQSTKGGLYRSPTLLVGEEQKTEYVIATNRAYRKRNIGILRAAANDLGIPMGDGPEAAWGGTTPIATASGNKKPRKPRKPGKKDPKKGTKDPKKTTDKKAATPTKPVISKWEQGFISTEDADKAVTKARTDRNARRSRIDNLEHRLADAKKKARKNPARKTKKKGEKKSPYQKQQEAIQDIADDLHLAKVGDSKSRVPVNKKAYSSLERILTTAERRAKEVHRFHDKAEEYKSIATTQRNIMETQATIYANTNDPKTKEAAFTAWGAAKTERERVLKLLQQAYAGAAALKGIDPTRKRELEELASGSLSELTTSELTEKLEGPDATIPSLEEFIRSVKLQPDLQKLQNDEALARYNTPRDEKNLAASLADDIAAAGKTVEFYENLYTKYKDDAAVPVPLKTEMLDAITNARDAVTSLTNETKGTTPDSGIDPATVRDTERYNTMRSFGSNAGTLQLSGASGGAYARTSPTYMDPEAGNAPSIYGSAFSGLRSGATYAAGSTAPTTKSTTVNVNNTFATVPPDPHTWSESVNYELSGIL